MEELRSDLETAKKKLRESERENTRMKRAMEKVTTLEAEKKKLESWRDWDPRSADLVLVPC